MRQLLHRSRCTGGLPGPSRPGHSRLPATVLLATVLLAAVLVLGAACQGGDESVAEGSAGEPVALAYPVAARESQVGPNTSSYYKVAPVSEATNYTASITELKDDADLFVYVDSGFSTIACTSAGDGTNAESCTATLPTGGGDTLYIKVKSASEKGTAFRLTVN